MDYRTRKRFEERRGMIEFIFERAAEQRYPFNDGAALAKELRLLNKMILDEDVRLRDEQLAHWHGKSIEELSEEIEMTGDFISEHHMEIDSDPEFGCKPCASANADIWTMTEIIASRKLPIAKCWCGRELRWFPSCGSMCSEGHDPSSDEYTGHTSFEDIF